MNELIFNHEINILIKSIFKFGFIYDIKIGPTDLMEEVALPSAAVDMTWTESEYDTKIDSDISFFPELSKIGNLDHTTLENLIGPKLNILIVALEDGSGKYKFKP